MACCGRNKTPANPDPSGGDLEKFAYLTPRQLKIREEQRRNKAEKDKV